jgi:hypothetical protein
MTKPSAAGLVRTLEIRAIVEMTGGFRPAARVLGLSAVRVRQIAHRPGAPAWEPPPKRRAETAGLLIDGDRTRKRCTRCLVVKPTSEFYRRGKAGLSSRCRHCNREIVANWKRAKARRNG